MRYLTLSLIGAALAACVACGERPVVVQGVVISYDQANATVVVKDELAPNAEVAFSLTGAAVGAEPAPGDQVRLAYRDAAGVKQATRMMNLTRQADLAGKGGGGH